MTIESTLAERGDRYGAFTHHAKIAQQLQDVMRAEPGWLALAADQKQALTVIADKIARMLSGDPNYRDNWHDIVGYAKLVDDRMAAEEFKPPAPAPIPGYIPQPQMPVAPAPSMPIGLSSCLVCGEPGGHFGMSCPKAVPVAHFGTGVKPPPPEFERKATEYPTPEIAAEAAAGLYEIDFAPPGPRGYCSTVGCMRTDIAPDGKCADCTAPTR